MGQYELGEIAKIYNLNVGDVIEIRYKNRQAGEWPWTGDPYIVTRVLNNGVVARWPFEQTEWTFLYREVEVRLLARAE